MAILQKATLVAVEAIAAVGEDAADRYSQVTGQDQDHLKSQPNRPQSHPFAGRNCLTVPTPEISRYTYQALQGKDEIRLLSLEPALLPDAPLRGTLHHSPLEMAEPYRAISYVWGDHAKPFAFQTPEGNISITATLRSALKRLRRKNFPVFLWADGITINQEDDREKEHQVRLMPRIYGKAFTTIVHLGDEADESDTAIRTLLQIEAANSDSSEPWPASLPPIPKAWLPNKMPTAEDAVWKTIGALFNRPWFRRVWIMQELLVSPAVKVVCGKWALGWDDIQGRWMLRRFYRREAGGRRFPVARFAPFECGKPRRDKNNVYERDPEQIV